MATIRVLVANRPRLMRDLVLAAISEQPDIEVLGTVDDDSKLMEAFSKLQPDLVVVSLDDSRRRPTICDHLLATNPRVKVLAVASKQDDSAFFWSDIRSVAVESSIEGILNVIRGKATVPANRVM